MITLRSRFFQADFDRKTGNWLGLTAIIWDNAPLLSHGAGFDLQLEGEALWEERSRQLGDFRYFAEGRGGAFIFEEGNLLLTYSVELDAALPVIYQSVLIKAGEKSARQLDTVFYSLPGFVIGNPVDCVVHLPGQAFDRGHSYLEMASSSGQVTADILPKSDPVLSFGLVAIENSSQHRIASCWMHVEIAPASPVLMGHGQIFDLIQRHQMDIPLKSGKTIISQGFCLLITDGTLDEHLTQFRRIAY